VSAQYIRQCSLVVAAPTGEGIDLGALRCVFEVRRGDQQTPNTCDVKVYNLAPNTVAQIAGKQPEFTQLILKVGYLSQPLAQIFGGSIIQVRLGREDQKNSYVAITAADGDEAYNFATAAFTMAANTTPTTSITNLIGQMQIAQQGTAQSDKNLFGAAPPITQAPLPKLPNNGSVRGQVFYGAARDELRWYCDAFDCKWSIQNGAVTIIPKTGYIPAAPVEVSYLTGLIGVPEQTQNGLKVRVLMNPALLIGQTIRLVSPINQIRLGLDVTSLAINPQLLASTLKQNSAGLYYVMRAEHTGDTRGEPWYTDLTCLAVDATVPINNVFTAVAPTPSVGTGAVPRY
jgi:hypothetical protein